MKEWFKNLLIMILILVCFTIFLIGVVFCASSIADENEMNDCEDLKNQGFIAEINDTGFWNYGLVCEVQIGEYKFSINNVKADLMNYEISGDGEEK